MTELIWLKLKTNWAIMKMICSCCRQWCQVAMWACKILCSSYHDSAFATILLSSGSFYAIARSLFSAEIVVVLAMCESRVYNAQQSSFNRFCDSTDTPHAKTSLILLPSHKDGVRFSSVQWRWLSSWRIVISCLAGIFPRRGALTSIHCLPTLSPGVPAFPRGNRIHPTTRILKPLKTMSNREGKKKTS